MDPRRRRTSRHVPPTAAFAAAAACAYVLSVLGGGRIGCGALAQAPPPPGNVPLPPSTYDSSKYRIGALLTTDRRLTGRLRPILFSSPNSPIICSSLLLAVMASNSGSTPAAVYASVMAQWVRFVLFPGTFLSNRVGGVLQAVFPLVALSFSHFPSLMTTFLFINPT